MMKKRYVIFSGGQLDDWALSIPRAEDIVVGADRGALFLIEHGITPDLAIGDFDSVNEGERAVIKQQSKKMIACDPIMKDLTDTEMAFTWVLQQNPDEIIVTGATGSRMDHTLANIHLLKTALEQGACCSIINQHNQICLINHHLTLTNEGYAFISLLPLTMKVTGITLKGFQYPLQQATLEIGQSLGISNRLVEAQGEISMTSGLLLVIQSNDEK